MVRTGSLRTQSARHRVDYGTICGRSALIRDTINHYGPVFIAPLSIQIRRAGVQKKFGGRAPGDTTALGTSSRSNSSCLDASSLIERKRLHMEEKWALR